MSVPHPRHSVPDMVGHVCPISQAFWSRYGRPCPRQSVPYPKHSVLDMVGRVPGSLLRGWDGRVPVILYEIGFAPEAFCKSRYESKSTNLTVFKHNFAAPIPPSLQGSYHSKKRTTSTLEHLQQCMFWRPCQDLNTLP